MSQTSSSKLLPMTALQRMEFSQAAKLDLRQLQLQAMLTVLSVTAIFLSTQPWGALAAISILLLIAAIEWLRHKSARSRSVAEKARRATLLVDGLGIQVPPAFLRDLLALSSQPPDAIPKWDDPSYFASTDPPGVENARKYLEESAFWSKHLYEASASRTLGWLVVSGLVLVVFFLMALSVVPHADSPLYVHVFATVASSFVFFDLVSRTLRYRGAAVETAAILQALSTRRGPDFSRDDLLVAIIDYNSIVEAAPLLAPGVYKANYDRLTQTWNRLHPSAASPDRAGHVT
ncbi:MAG: hypothetical protein KJZ78_19090 [Bryobacteraceae bacterium]|nr:hypothetical protein [Bryobacteraceae bacterium]